MIVNADDRILRKSKYLDFLVAGLFGWMKKEKRFPNGNLLSRKIKVLLRACDVRHSDSSTYVNKGMHHIAKRQPNLRFTP